MIRAFLHGLPMGFARIFAPRYLVWHVVMIILTYLCVVSGFDWYYFTQTRFDNLYALTLPAALLGFFVPIALPVVMYYFGEWQGRAKLMQAAIAVAQAEALAWVVSSLYKSLTGRIVPEFLPSTAMQDISRWFDFGFWERGIFGGWPSSHTAVAFAGMVALIWLYPKNKPLALLAGAYALYIGLGVSVSVHWFSAFLAGAGLGTLVGVVVARHAK
mgnify:CR=1 FL=1